jgi:hypothetical protein
LLIVDAFHADLIDDVRGSLRTGCALDAAVGDLRLRRNDPEQNRESEQERAKSHAWEQKVIVSRTKGRRAVMEAQPAEPVLRWEIV